jgi:hypothetical protein
MKLWFYLETETNDITWFDAQENSPRTQTLSLSTKSEGGRAFVQAKKEGTNSNKGELDQNS